MTNWPLRFRTLNEEIVLFADDAGGFFCSDENFLQRYAGETLNQADVSFLRRGGHSFGSIDDLLFFGFSFRWAARQHLPQSINYVILVPTLRCNLACSYCQVSRVNESTLGFDWQEDTLEAVLCYLDSLETKTIKIEFQGGEPLLRLDLLERVRTFCRARFPKCEFVVCSNLQNVSEQAWDFLGGRDTYVSTSLDGNLETHQAQRTKRKSVTARFRNNLDRALRDVGPERVSALPTLDPNNPPAPEVIVRTYLSYGFRSIYLRPMNYHGFARKRFDVAGVAEKWNEYYAAFIDYLIAWNDDNEPYIEEYYFTHCLRRVLRAGHNNHTDLRNPNILGTDYIVIDQDGVFYPTDEARMITRVRQIDLAIGNVVDGIDMEKLALLNANSSNYFNPDCIHCPYQPYCGTDVVDDLSRYGRVDLPKHETDFCQKHLFIFDKIFTLLYDSDPKVQRSLALWAGVPAISPVLTPVHA